MQKFFHRVYLLPLVILVGFVLVGCSSTSETPEDESASPTSLPPTEIFTATPQPPTATFTEVPPTETPTVRPSETATAHPTGTPTSTLTETPTSTVTKDPNVSSGTGFGSGSVMIYYIHQGTGGPVCGTDSAVGVRSGVNASDDIAKNIKEALKILFAYKGKKFGELFNYLLPSNIKVQHVEFDPKTGLITVNLSGSYKPTGNDCDNTRVKAQVWNTIRQYSQIKATNIYLNGIPFGDRVSNDR